MEFAGRDFLQILDFSSDELRYMLEVAKTFKNYKQTGQSHKYFPDKNIVLLFEKTSTRTRCSFEVAGHDLGMGVTYLDPAASQMGHKESIADTAQVLAKLYDGIEYRGFAQKTVDDLAKYANVPVWNGLTDYCHPTQALADFLTIEEHFGSLAGLTVAYLGDTRNNVANSLMAMSAKMGVNYIACGPEALQPDPEFLGRCQAVAAETGSTITITTDSATLAGQADVVYTDVWLSMGEDKAKWGERIEQLRPYQVTMEILNLAKPSAVFMHPLPSFHDLETSVGRDVHEKFGLSELEVTDEVFTSDRSLVFEEAENRMHTIKAVMYLTLKDKEQ